MPQTTVPRTTRRSRKRSRSSRRHRRRVQASSVGRAQLPSWKDLQGESETDSTATRSTMRFVAVVAIIAAALTLYVGHVQATQQLVVNLQQERSENQRLRMRKDRLKGEFDRATGPAVIYERAAELGLQEGSGSVYQLELPSR